MSKPEKGIHVLYFGGQSVIIFTIASLECTGGTPGACLRLDNYGSLTTAEGTNANEVTEMLFDCCHKSYEVTF